MSLVSVITVNLNNVDGLAKTIQSLLDQTFVDYEFIIIDGGSTDGSVELVKSHVDKLAYWVSEPDKGIYHAMNKGIQASTGEYCLFLNSGDWLVESTTLATVFAKRPQADIVAGDIYFFDTQTSAIKWFVSSPDKLTAKTLFLGTLPHQATFIRRSLFDAVGLYNEHLKITSDWLFFLEALLIHGCSYQHYPVTVANFNMDGISCNPNTASLPRREQLSVLQQRYPLFVADYEELSGLESQSQLWLQSREYQVYHFLKRAGVIRVGVFGHRLKRFLQRTFFNQRTS
ncbi:glycosyltransferase [Spirosoma sp. RP8]|uniref:Glycosyltransferase n=1 Tax=Spirosoma liriopis TaxID=2937440 RepID=A0ABT0HRU1_9BACT|nr:glycosyltransferase family 2 protein [Spirosoma liriopis]MCK8494889.1 glycosyltransferase [Spirosoma liriopis]